MTIVIKPSDVMTRNFEGRRYNDDSSPVLVQGEQGGVLVASVHQDEPSFRDPMESLVSQWVALATSHARVRRIGDLFLADVVGIDGAWAEGESPEEALSALPDVLSDWVLLKLEDGDRDIPPMEGIKLVTD
jgi:predicted RNase H-like HicB family nuclease